jgi:hypothetical protein
MASFGWPGRMIIMPAKYPEEFRDDVVLPRIDGAH